MRARWDEAVCGVTPASLASSPAVSALPDISAVSMFARAGSPTRAASGAMSGPWRMGMSGSEFDD